MERKRVLKPAFFLPKRTKMREGLKLEGFWYSKYSPEFPKPKPGPEWKNKDKFIEKLTNLEERLERKRAPYIVFYRGYSNCRCCNKFNGTAEFHYKGWCWPTGFMHYVKDHEIKPSDEFIEFILEGK